MVIDYPPLDNLQLTCYSSDGSEKIQESGDNTPISKWPIVFRKPTFLLEESFRECTLKFSGGSSLQLPITLYNYESFNNLKLEDSIVQSVYFGALFCIFIYNLLITIFTKLRLYIVYCLFLAGYGLFQINMLGIGYQYLWNQFPQFWIDKSVAFFLNIVIISAYFFMFGLLDLEEKNPKMFKIGKYLTIISLIPLFLFLFIEYSLLIKLIYILLVIVIFFLLSNSIILSLRGDRIAQIYTIAWVVFLLGSLLFLMKTLGIVNRNIITNYSTQVGSVLEFILLSIAMGYRINLMQNIISLNLEEQVVKRTNDLIKEKEISVKALVNLDRQNSMIQAVIGSKNSIELFSNINLVLRKNYSINTYIIYTEDEDKNYLKVFDIIVNDNQDNDILEKIKLNRIPIFDPKSAHGSCFRNSKSLYSYKIKTNYLCDEEVFNIEYLDIKGIYIIPMIYNGQCFGAITFTDNKYFKSNIYDLSKSQRDEIQNFVKLISPSIYQFIQKSKIEKALIEVQQTQSQLIEAERMASLGQLVGGVAHEINNPIGVIRSNSELISNNINSLLFDLPIFLDSLTNKEREVFYSIVNQAIQNKEFLTTKQERLKVKEIKLELEDILKENQENIDYISKQILLLKIKSPYKNYITLLGESKFIESLSIAQIFVNQSNSIANIEIAVEKASRVVFALRSYLNTEIFLEKKEINIIREIEKSIHLYDNYIMGKVTLFLDFYNKELYYNCNSENLSQVWKNIIFNAIQAMYLTEKRLEIKIERLNNLPDRLKTMKSSAIADDSQINLILTENWILVSIIDSGDGISEDQQDKIFTPFYTTKALGEGIGLGLYVSKKIIHELRGKIYFESRKGRTEFVIVLPD
jgi:signal transduction histidine kinase